jgi:hypothetical protein
VGRNKEIGDFSSINLYEMKTVLVEEEIIYIALCEGDFLPTSLLLLNYIFMLPYLQASSMYGLDSGNS